MKKKMMEVEKMEETKPEPKGKINYKIVLLVAVIVLISVAIISLVTAILLVIALAVAVLAIYYLAQIGKFIFMAEEGYAIIIEYAGEYYKTLFRYKGKVADKDGNIKNVQEGEAPERHFWGGLVWIGIWPFFKIKEYTLRWKSLRPDGQVLYRVEKLKQILLKDDVYLIQMLKKGEVDERPETSEKIPVEVTFLMTARVINPYKAIYVAQDWYEMVTNRIKQLVKEYIGSKTFEELISPTEESRKILFQKISGEVNQALNKATGGEMPLVKIFRENYGVEVSGVEPYSITPDPKFVDPSTKKYVAEREAEAKVAEAIGAAKAVLISAEAEITRINSIYSTLTGYGIPGLFIKAQETNAEIAKSGKATFVLAPTGSVDQIGKLLLGSGISEKTIDKLKTKLAEMKVRPEELLKTLDVMKAIESNPKMKALWEKLAAGGKNVTP